MKNNNYLNIFSQFHIDTSNIGDYHLRAGLHCQTVLADRIRPHQNIFLLRDSSMCTSRLFPVAVGRERDTFGVLVVVPVC